jgi:hypothetical protein
MTVFEMMHRSLFSQRWSQGPSCFGRFSVDDPGPLPTPRDRWMWCKRNDSCMGTIGCGRADSAPYHAVNGLFSRLQVVHPLSTIHSVMTEDFLWYIFGCILHLCDYLHQFTSFWLCPFLVTFVSQVLKDLRGYEAGLRGWGGEVMAGHVTRRVSMQNLKNLELARSQDSNMPSRAASFLMWMRPRKDARGMIESQKDSVHELQLNDIEWKNECIEWYWMSWTFQSTENSVRLGFLHFWADWNV